MGRSVRRFWDGRRQRQEGAQHLCEGAFADAAQVRFVGRQESCANRLGKCLEDGLRHFLEGSHLVHNSQLDGRLRHAVNHAALLVLGERPRPGGPKRLHTAGAIAAHAGQQHGHRLRAGVLGGRTEQHIHRGTAVMHGRRLRQPGPVAASEADQRQMKIAGGHQA